MNIIIIIAAILISLAIGIPVGMAYRKKVAESKIQGAEKEAKSGVYQFVERRGQGEVRSRAKPQKSSRRSYPQA